MKIMTIDFETYYDKDYSLTKLTTEAYVRDPRFEVLMVGIMIDGGEPRIMAPLEFIAFQRAVNWNQYTVLCHHAHFDGAIMSWHYNIKPKLWLDTLSMARAVVGGNAVNYSLDTLSTMFGVGKKGREVTDAKGKHIHDFSPDELSKYEEYCKNDVVITRLLFEKLYNGMYGSSTFPRTELKLIDRIVRMFTQPALLLDPIMLHDFYQEVLGEKEDSLKKLIEDIDPVATMGEMKKTVGSSAKFAELLEARGVTVPMKVSLTTGKTTYAFAKTDQEFAALKLHSDPVVRQLVNTRLTVKSTTNETRAKTLIGMAERGAAPIYYNYSGADQTHRLSGGDKTNFQNLGRRGVLRNCILAPEGKKIVVVDSSNIEARILDSLAGQEDMVDVYRKYDRGEGPDIYCCVAGEHYGRKITKGVDIEERQFGKTIKLGCGFQMGASRFRDTAREQAGTLISEEEARKAVNTYRNSHKEVKKLWYRTDDCIESMFQGTEVAVDYRGLIGTTKNGFVLPNGLVIKYPELRRDADDQWIYTHGRITTNLYGGKGVENFVQALARIVVMDQCEAVSTLHPDCTWVMSSHDEGVWVVPEAKTQDVLDDALMIFSKPPEWWPDLPLNAEGGHSERYGWAKE